MKQLILHVEDKFNGMEGPTLVDAYKQDSTITFAKHMLPKKHVQFIK